MKGREGEEQVRARLGESCKVEEDIWKFMFVSKREREKRIGRV